MGPGDGRQDEGPYARAGGRLPGDPAPDPGLGDDPPPVPPRQAEARRAPAAQRLVRPLPALLIAAGIAYDHFTPQDFTAAPFFTAAPLAAASLYSLRATLRTGVAAVFAVVLVHLQFAPSASGITEIVTVATVAFLACVVNRVVRRTGARLASAREIAEAAQLAVLPTPAARIGGLEIAARYEAAQQDAFIGGDLYAVQDSPHGVRLVVGDVRGKGMGAVAAVAVVIGAFREAAEQEATLEAVAQRLERALAREGTRRDGLDAFEGFTTALLAEFPHGAGAVRVVNRGHPPPLLLESDGTLRVLAGPEAALPLGMGELGIWPDRAVSFPFPRGSILLCHTDGLSEARDAHGAFYDPAARLAGRVFSAPDGLLAFVTEQVRRHTGGGAADDMAMLAVRRP